MEIPTTSNLKTLEAFHDVFLEHIRPVAEHDRASYIEKEELEHDQMRQTFIPSSIIMDVVSYLKYHLSEFAAEEVLRLGGEDDTEAMITRCGELDPYFKATRALALALHVFATEPSETFVVKTESE
jgi:hypothetical protein